MKYVLYYRYRLGEPEASAFAMEQQREAAELIKSDGGEVEAEYIEYEIAQAGEDETDPRPKLRMAFEHVARLREQACDAQLAILRVARIGTGDPFDWVDESAWAPEQRLIISEGLEARGEAGELLRKYRGRIDPDWGFEYFLQEIAEADFHRRQRDRPEDE